MTKVHRVVKVQQVLLDRRVSLVIKVLKAVKVPLVLLVHKA